MSTLQCKVLILCILLQLSVLRCRTTHKLKKVDPRFYRFLAPAGLLPFALPMDGAALEDSVCRRGAVGNRVKYLPLFWFGQGLTVKELSVFPGDEEGVQR